MVFVFLIAYWFLVSTALRDLADVRFAVIRYIQPSNSKKITSRKCELHADLPIKRGENKHPLAPSLALKTENDNSVHYESLIYLFTQWDGKLEAAANNRQYIRKLSHFESCLTGHVNKSMVHLVLRYVSSSVPFWFCFWFSFFLFILFYFILFYFFLLILFSFFLSFIFLYVCVYMYVCCAHLPVGLGVALVLFFKPNGRIC